MAVAHRWADHCVRCGIGGDSLRTPDRGLPPTGVAGGGHDIGGRGDLPFTCTEAAVNRGRGTPPQVRPSGTTSLASVVTTASGAPGAQGRSTGVPVRDRGPT
ncbi:hypothetical protein GCM10027162_38980 [Streptomyces incanus]